MNSVQLEWHVKVAQQLLQALDCPRALTVDIMLRHGMYKDILELPLSFEYADSENFFRHYQATKLLSKASWLPSGIDKKEVAIQKFKEAEQSCSLVNKTFEAVRSGRATFLRPDADALIFKVRRKIADVLGALNYHWVEDCNFGPGADKSTRSGFTAAYNKLETAGSCTAETMPYLSALIENSPILARKIAYDIRTRLPMVEIDLGNKVTFVPKNSKTDRSIAVEPRWNIFFQKGVGRYIRRRLGKFGINLDDQTVNQRLAQTGSATGKYATLDLKAASDTVSREIVWELLPIDWADLLDRLRSKVGSLQGSPLIYEKWSSMGNGYTFELESLLFFAICSAFTDDISVYGDDLIVPSEHYHEVVEALHFFGFSTNVEKSFSAGPFRESCGADYFSGVKVTPIYWKDPLNDKGTLRLVNQVTVLAQRLSDGFNRCSAFRRVHSDLVRRLPDAFRVYGPTCLSTVVHEPKRFWNEVRGLRVKFPQWDGCWLRVCIPKPRKFRFRCFDAAIGHVLLSPSTDGYGVRDRYVYKKDEVFIPSGNDHVGIWM